MGHARAILGSPSPELQLSIYKKILAQGLSVRKVEELVNSTKHTAKAKPVTTTYAQQQELLANVLQLPVKITSNKLTISFHSEEDLKAVINRLI